MARSGVWTGNPRSDPGSGRSDRGSGAHQGTRRSCSNGDAISDSADGNSTRSGQRHRQPDWHPPVGNQSVGVVLFAPSGVVGFGLPGSAAYPQPQSRKRVQRILPAASPSAAACVTSTFTGGGSACGTAPDPHSGGGPGGTS